MDSQKALKWHIAVFKVTGLLSPEKPSNIYSYYSITVSILSFILFPLSALSCVFFLDSIDSIVENLILTSSSIMLAVKGFNLLIKQRVFVELLNNLKKLDVSVTQTEFQRIFLPKVGRSHRLLLLFGLLCMLNWFCVALQVIVLPMEERMWLSTLLYPIEILHHPIIYVGGVVFQCLASLHQVSVACAVDTYCTPLIDTINGHYKVLGERLSVLGCSLANRKSKDCLPEKLTLVDLCEKYIVILKYTKLLGDLFSFAMFGQFGVSGIVLCTCAYQLSVLNPIDDFAKFSFSVAYSFAMIIEIFVPAYFGSSLIHASSGLSHAAYKSNWMELDDAFKRSMKILVERTLRPVSVQVAGIFQLDLNSMLSILKTAYSLFAVLKNVE